MNKTYANESQSLQVKLYAPKDLEYVISITFFIVSVAFLLIVILIIMYFLCKMRKRSKNQKNTSLLDISNLSK